MKKCWQNKRKAEGKPYDKPNMIMNSAVQVCWEVGIIPYLYPDHAHTSNRKPAAISMSRRNTSTAHLTDTSSIPRRLLISVTRTPLESVRISPQFIGSPRLTALGAILGTTYTGEYEDIKAINDLLVERNIDVDIHVDAASGGFVAPFVDPGLLWDFRLPKVTGINVSGHKYGLVYPGVGWVVWRDPKYLPQELVFNINYLGADQASFTLNFSRGASQIIGQYYQLIRLGKRGYRRVMLNLTRTADYLSKNLESLGFIIMSKSGGEGLPLVACRLDENSGKMYDEFAVYVSHLIYVLVIRMTCVNNIYSAHQLRERGWVVPAYTMAPHSEQMKMIRVVVREDFTKSRCDALITDFKLAMQTLDQLDAKKIQENKEYVSSNKVSTKTTFQSRISLQ